MLCSRGSGSRETIANLNTIYVFSPNLTENRESNRFLLFRQMLVSLFSESHEMSVWSEWEQSCQLNLSSRVLCGFYETQNAQCRVHKSASLGVSRRCHRISIKSNSVLSFHLHLIFRRCVFLFRFWVQHFKIFLISTLHKLCKETHWQSNNNNNNKNYSAHHGNVNYTGRRVTHLIKLNKNE